MGINRILKYKKLFVVCGIVPGRKREVKALLFSKKVRKKDFYGYRRICRKAAEISSNWLIAH